MIHVAARSEEWGEAFRRRHPTLLDEITVHLGQGSLFELIDSLIASDVDTACFVHDDVTLPTSFIDRVAEFITTASTNWPNWGVAGNAGISHLGVGLGTSPVVRYLADPHGGPNNVGEVIPVESVDGNVLLLNCAALRARGVRLPPFDGFHLYDLALSVETLAAGLAVVCVPQLGCYHDSAGDQAGFDASVGSDSFRDYLASRVTNTSIVTLNGPIDLNDRSGLYRDCDRVDLGMASLRNAQIGRNRRSVSVVTRSQLLRPALLQRCVASVASFAAAARHVDVRHVVITSNDPEEAVFDSGVEVVVVPDDSGRDNRFRLVQHAIRHIESDYLWFVDDDDWLFPNDAELIALALAIAPAGSPVFVDSQHFREAGSTVASEGALPSLRSSPGRRFPASEFMLSLSGHNHTPFCSAVLNRVTLLAIPDELFQKIVYFEDFALVLHSVLQPRVTPIAVSTLGAGISVRAEGHSVVESDRTIWNQSMAELTTHLVDDAATPLLSLPGGLRLGASEVGGLEAEALQLREQNHRLQRQLDGALHELERVSQSLSWRLARPFRGVHKLLTRNFASRP